MAKAKKPSKSKTSPAPSMRELAKAGQESKGRSLKSRRPRVSKAFKKVLPTGGKRRKVINLPDNRFGRILDKILFAIPRYFRGAWSEIRQTTWPNRKETIRLTFAVFVFSIVFAVFVAFLDFVLDKIFKHLIT